MKTKFNNNLPKFLVVDTETGGLVPGKNALLTAAFILLDSQLNELDHLELSFKTGRKKVDEEALKVNKIVLTEHNKNALTNKKAALVFNTWLGKHFKKPPHFLDKMIPIGHNFSFDYGFLRANFPEIDLHPYISHNPIDTCSNVQMMKLLGIHPMNFNASLTSIAKKIGIKDTSDAHNALVDTRLCIEVLKWQQKEIEKFYNGNQ